MRLEISSFSVFRIQISMNFKVDIKNRRLTSRWIEPVAQEVEISSEWWKNDKTWKSWNLRWDSKSNHFQDFTIELRWISDLISPIESSHWAESITVLEKSRYHQNAEKNWNLWKSLNFRSKNHDLSIWTSRSTNMNWQQDHYNQIGLVSLQGGKLCGAHLNDRFTRKAQITEKRNVYVIFRKIVN